MNDIILQMVNQNGTFDNIIADNVASETSVSRAYHSQNNLSQPLEDSQHSEMT